MSFNLDDPLAGILSDGSDDSFFDDDILGKKKPTKKTTPIAEKKNALFDLGDDDKSKPKASGNRKDSLLDIGSTNFKQIAVDGDIKKIEIDKPKSPEPLKRSVSKDSIKFQNVESKSKPVSDKLDLKKSPGKTKISSSADKLDILGQLTTETKKDVVKPLEKRKSSQSLLDDILGGSTIKPSGTSLVTRPVTTAKSQDFDFDSFLGKSEAKSNVSLDKNVSKKQSIKDENIKGDSGIKKVKSSDDWLGIIMDKELDDGDEVDSGMPAWLVGDSKTKKSTDTMKKSVKETIPKEPSKEVTEEQENLGQVELEKEQLNTKANLEQLTQTVPSIFQGSNEDITVEGAALYMQQQESQLMVALQLKAQEEKLAAMQIRQKETQRLQRDAAQAHHSQLDSMLRRQADQRQQMQAIINTHQERITQRIKALLGTHNMQNEENNPEDDNFESSLTERRESPQTKEKKQLLQLVQSLQENHDKEIDLMETSYRRQLAFLEVSVNQAEERMKDESDRLVKYYTEKISWLVEHHDMYKKLTEENLNSLTERHKAENEMIRQQHLDNIKVLQEHHATLMENIKNALKQEQVLIQDSASYSSDLRELVNDVKESKTQCQQLVEKVQSLNEVTHHNTEKSVHSRETQINEMILQLKKERDNFETEKSENRDIVKMLETRLRQMTTMIEEETASLKQKKMEFEFEKATFNKQTEFAKNVLKKQNEEIKMLKEDIQKEYQEKVTKIDEEKAKALKDSAAVAKEKASIQSLKQELEKTNTELQAHLEEVTEERSKLNLEKQQMHMEEQRILAKSRDLDLLAKTAIEKQAQADKKYSEAEFIQQKYEDRIRRIQEHVVSMNAREKQIAREKVTLSRERLTLHNEKKQIESKQQCSLCKSAQNIPSYNFETNYTLPETYMNVPVSRTYVDTNVNSTMNAIEQEMAHLIGRTFSLRHSAGFDDNERFGRDRVAVEDNFQATQSTPVESGTFKDYMDPKFMMLRLDVQRVLSNLDQNKTDDVERDEQENED